MCKERKALIECEIHQALDTVDGALMDMLMEEILAADTVFLYGVDGVRISLQFFCKRLKHLGIRAQCIRELNESAATENSLLIIGSEESESISLMDVIKKTHDLGTKIAYIGAAPNIVLREYIDLFVRIPLKIKLELIDQIESSQVMSRLFEQSLLVLGDVISIRVAEIKAGRTKKEEV